MRLGLHTHTYANEELSFHLFYVNFLYLSYESKDNLNWNWIANYLNSNHSSFQSKW